MGRWNKKGAPGSFRVHRAPHTHSRCTERVPSVLRPRQPRRAAPDHRITSTSAAKMFGWLKGSGKTPAAQRQARLAASAWCLLDASPLVARASARRRRGGRGPLDTVAAALTRTPTTPRRHRRALTRPFAGAPLRGQGPEGHDDGGQVARQAAQHGPGVLARTMPPRPRDDVLVVSPAHDLAAVALRGARHPTTGFGAPGEVGPSFPCLALTNFMTDTTMYIY